MGHLDDGAAVAALFLIVHMLGTFLVVVESVFNAATLPS